MYPELGFELLCFHCVLVGFGSQAGAKPFLIRPGAERQSCSKTKTQHLKYRFCYSFVLPGIDQLL